MWEIWEWINSARRTWRPPCFSWLPTVQMYWLPPGNSNPLTHENASKPPFSGCPLRFQHIPCIANITPLLPSYCAGVVVGRPRRTGHGQQAAPASGTTHSSGFDRFGQVASSYWPRPLATQDPFRLKNKQKKYKSPNLIPLRVGAGCRANAGTLAPSVPRPRR